MERSALNVEHGTEQLLHARDYQVCMYSSQCRIKGDARGALAPGPAVLGACNWWEW